MVLPSKCDIVVIGAGPAGNTAASLLAKEGLEVVLLDKAKAPRPNVGESLIPQFWRYTDMTGATEAIASEGFMRKSGGLALWNGRMRQIRFPDFGYDRPTYHVERGRFDEILLDTSRRNGVQIFEETTVTHIDPGGDDDPSVSYRTKEEEEGTIETRYVVDASGQSAVLARQLGIREFDPDIRFLSLWGYYEGGHYLTIDGEVEPYENRWSIPPCTFISSLGDWGWIWHIMLRESVSIGLILPPERLQAFKAKEDTKESKFQGLVADSPVTGELMRDATFVGPMFGIRDYAYKPTKLAVGRCYLAGDAAAFVDPINSAGVPFGMYSGFLSSWAILSSLRRPERRVGYREIYCKLYGNRLELFRLLAMPSDASGVERAAEVAKQTVRNTGLKEVRLMLAQAVHNSRGDGIEKVLEGLGLPTAVNTKTIEVPQLT